MRFHSLNRLFFNLCSNCSIVTPSAPAAPPFLFTFNHASSGGRVESHRPAPTDPGVTISRHRALVILITRHWGRKEAISSARTDAGTTCCLLYTSDAADEEDSV